MWHKWLPWKYMVRTVARRRGFIDPIAILSRFNAIAQPAETMGPIELLRAGLVLHARGFINNRVIEHNLDWVWPLWVVRQFNPLHGAFIPRAFSMTHINLTQRNWTAVGYPGCLETPVVDAHGLLMPFFDSWSLDGWFQADSGESLVPSRMESVSQKLEIDPNLRVLTEARSGSIQLRFAVEVLVEEGKPVCRLSLEAFSSKPGWLAASVRPYNSEGISFINDLSLLSHSRGWEINKEHAVHFSEEPDEHLLSTYREGDVYLSMKEGVYNHRPHVMCRVGLATGAALYRVQAGEKREVSLTIPLETKETNVLEPDIHGESAGSKDAPSPTYTAEQKWRECLYPEDPSGRPAGFSGGDSHERFLYEAALRTVLLLSPKKVLAGPYTYKRFWYRDAAIILHAFMCAGYQKQTEVALDYCVSKQSLNGYFQSQEGEWDSNGQMLWILGRYCRLFQVSPKPQWLEAIRKGVLWIHRKRLKELPGERHSGLMPAGYSAEHFGPNDFYYWDDFWTLGGLRLAEEMLRHGGEDNVADLAAREYKALAAAVDQSLRTVSEKLKSPAIPVSPYRRMESAAVGSLAVGFPLQLWPAADERLKATVNFLWDNCRIRDALYHDVAHSGINPYLSLHLAQCLLRARDPRFRSIMRAVGVLASPTGQWPEAIHPQLGTGCMGDGQHTWAAAEWIMMVRNCFLFEEEYEDKLVIAAGLSPEWCGEEGLTRFGPAPTRFGPVTVTLEVNGEEVVLSWSGKWFHWEPQIEVAFPETGLEKISQENNRCIYRKRGDTAKAQTPKLEEKS